MKKSLLIISILLLFNSHLFGQYTIDWINPCGIFNKIAVTSTIDNSDNLIVTGYYQSENMYTRKYDINGNFRWENIDSSGIQSLYEKPIWMNCDSNNNIYVVGKRYAIGSGWEYPDAIVAVKYSSSGVLLWRQTVPVSTLIGSSHPDFNLKSLVDNNGNLYIGTTAAIPSGFVFIKLDSVGNIAFVNNNTVNAPNGFTSMHLKDNMIVMTGGGAGAVIAWDTSGALLWTTSITGAGYDVEIDSTGNIYLLASMTNQVSPTSAQDIVLYKLNSSGTQLWKRNYDFNGADFPTRFTLVANKLSVIGWGSNNSTGSTYFDWKIFQVDSSGTLNWSADYNGTASNDEYPYNLIAKPNGKVIVTGIGGPSPFPLQSLSYIQMVNVEYSNTGAKLWIDTPNVYGGRGLACHIASDGSLFVSSYYNMTAYHYLTTSVGLNSNENTMHESATIFPNPFQSTTTLEFNLTERKNYSISIFDVVGRKVKNVSSENLQVGKNKITIDLSGFNNGIYFCQLISNQNSQTIMLVKN